MPLEEETKGEQKGMEAGAVANTAGPAVKVEVVQNNQSTNSAGVSADATLTSNPDISVRGLGKDKFHPVMCKICNTKVAVYDTDEVYHFFNVVTSY